MEGRSLVPAFRGNRGLAREALFWEHEGNKAVRQREWKAVAQGRGEWALFDMRNDRSETRDLAAQHPEKTRELAALWRAWADRCGVWEWDDLQKHRQPASKQKQSKRE
jgi:arylsulfatase A-like enzyme